MNHRHTATHEKACQFLQSQGVPLTPEVKLAVHTLWGEVEAGNKAGVFDQNILACELLAYAALSNEHTLCESDLAPVLCLMLSFAMDNCESSLRQYQLGSV